MIRTGPTSAKQRAGQFASSGSASAAPEKRTSDESPIGSFTAMTQFDIGARGLGSATFVPMMESAHLWDRHDPSGFPSLHGG
jgi:hypothetical protein